MKKVLALAFLCTSMLSWGWGQKGHDVTAYIAEQHITAKTKAAVDSLLEGKSMVYWANWLDNASHTDEYAYSKTWHYKNVDEGVRYEEAPANPAGDAVTAIKSRIEILKDANSSFSDKQLALKMLVHIMGDLHQPMHMGHATDLGGNRTTVKYFGKETNLHSIWDSNLVESAHKWSYTEWQQQVDRPCPKCAKKCNTGTKNSCSKITSGTIDDWAKETMAITDEVYDAMPENTNISYNEIADWSTTIEKQLLRGGIRLAYILNSIFDN